MVQVWQIERDGFKAEWIDRGADPAIIRVTGPGLLQPFEVQSNGEDAIDQLNQAIELATPATQVHFRMIGTDVIALFPAQEESRFKGERVIASYMHVGQHSAASAFLVQELVPATPEQYKDLKAELEAEPYKYKLEVLP